jgi:Ca2+-binding RTX toxin-like protein
MVRQLTKSDLLIETNKDGNFFYIKPNIEEIATKKLVSEDTVRYSSDLKGLYVWDDQATYQNLYAEGVKKGLAVLDPGLDFRVYDYTFFNTVSDTRFASAIYRGENHTGNAQFLRVYANGQDKAGTSVEIYKTANTDFFDNNNRVVAADSVTYFRDITAHDFADAIFDIKSVTYISNVTISDAFRLLRAHNDTTIVIANSVINSGSGKELAMIEGYNAKIYYYNCLWDGASSIDYDKVGIAEVYGGSAERAQVIRENVIELKEDPFKNIDFFQHDPDRYRAQVSVNGDAWIDISLPENGWLGRVVGDTLVKLPDLGNGVYRVRAWAIDESGAASSRVTTDSVKITTSSFAYKGGSTALDGPVVEFGGAGDEVLYGTSGADELHGGGGKDLISGNLGNDRLFGDGGDDVLNGHKGDDVLYGGDGNDILWGGDGDDWLQGGAGVDVIYGEGGSDTVDFSDVAKVSGGYVINIGNGIFRRADGTGGTERFYDIENAVGTQGDDRIIGTSTPNRITGGAGADVLTGNGGADMFIFDNKVDFGADRITDMNYSRELWFTEFTDLGADNAARIDSKGYFTFSYGDGGARDIYLGMADRWIEYQGKNSEGYHVYKLLQGGWPTVDILPDSGSTSSPGASLLPQPTITGDAVWEREADFSNAPNYAAGYVIDLDKRAFARADAPSDAIVFQESRDVIGTSSNDRIIGDYHANRIEGGRGADVLTGGGADDVFVFDNSNDFGADRITDMNFSRELWFTQFTDLGSDNVGRIDSKGYFTFSYGDGGARDIYLGMADRWVEYQGQNSEGYHVYGMMRGDWPTVDILPDSGARLSLASSVLPQPTITGDAVWEREADFSNAPNYAAGYVIDLDKRAFARADAPSDAIVFQESRDVIGTSSNDRIIGDYHANRIEGGRGADVLTGGGADDVFVFDNSNDFGADRITDMNFSRELWFTQFTDLGSDGVGRISPAGTFAFAINDGWGERELDLGMADRWIEYQGVNDEGYHVYAMMRGEWPGQDILPV